MDMSEQYSRSPKKQNRLSIDRISDLPDSILCHILSFLPTKFSVRTSTLARRWRYLWAYVSNLSFDYENADTINRVLLLRKLHNINTFYLADGIERNTSQIDTWISFAVERSVQKINIYLGIYVDLPRCVFTCKTLVDLRLDNCGVIPDFVYLPHLKKLNVIDVKYEGDESLSHLISGCPVLEELIIHLYIDHCSCKISSPTIKKLMLDIVFHGEESDNQDYNKVEINTPAVVYLQLLDCTKQYIKCGALNSVIEADINIDNTDNNIKPLDGFLYSRSLLGFIDRCSNVKCLKLDVSRSTEIIDSVFSAWTISFRNLTKLELTSDCCFLSKFLENADNLEILILREVQEEMKGWMEPQQVPTCLLSRLRTIKLLGITGKKHEFEIIRYLLRNAQVLERMEIVYPSIYNPVEKMFTIYKLKEILLFERGSKACVVAFVSK